VIGLSSEQNNGNVAGLGTALDAFQQFYAVHVWHNDIAYHQVGNDIGNAFQCFLTISIGMYMISVAKFGLEELADIFIIVNNSNVVDGLSSGTAGLSCICR